MIFDPERIPLAMVAILLAGVAGLITGPMFGNAVPLFWMVCDKVFGKFGSRLDRPKRKLSDLMTRGLFLTLVAVGFFYLCGKLVDNLAMGFRFGGVTEIVLLSLTLSAGSVWFSLLKLFFAMTEKKQSKNAFYTIAVTTRTDLSKSDDYTMTRMGMSLSARMFDKGIVAPVLWYLIGGLPMAYLYAGFSFLSWRFGREGFSAGFGKVPSAIEQLMGYVPNVFAGFLLAGAGLLTPTGGMMRAFMALMKPDGRTPYAEGGVPVTAMANALHVALNGPTVDLDGMPIKRAWAGPNGATAQLDAGHLRRAIYISMMAHLLFLAGMGVSLMLSGLVFG